MVNEFLKIGRMMKMKKIKCKVCDCEFIPQVKGHYIARTDGKTGVVAAFQSNDETGLFDAFDCPQCGCQVIAQERKRAYIISHVDDIEYGEEESEGEEETIPARPHKKRVPPESEG